MNKKEIKEVAWKYAYNENNGGDILIPFFILFTISMSLFLIQLFDNSKDVQDMKYVFLMIGGLGALGSIFYFFSFISDFFRIKNNISHPIIDKIIEENNQEIKTLMIKIYGKERYLKESKAKIVHQDDFGTLYMTEAQKGENEKFKMEVKVVNATPEGERVLKQPKRFFKNNRMITDLSEIELYLSYQENGLPLPPDISFLDEEYDFIPKLDEKGDLIFKDYFLRVPPTMKTAREAVAWTFGKKEHEYSPLIET